MKQLIISLRMSFIILATVAALVSCSKGSSTGGTDPVVHPTEKKVTVRNLASATPIIWYGLKASLSWQGVNADSYTIKSLPPTEENISGLTATSWESGTLNPTTTTKVTYTVIGKNSTGSTDSMSTNVIACSERMTLFCKSTTQLAMDSSRTKDNTTGGPFVKATVLLDSNKYVYHIDGTSVTEGTITITSPSGFVGTGHWRFANNESQYGDANPVNPLSTILLLTDTRFVISITYQEEVTPGVFHSYTSESYYSRH